MSKGILQELLVFPVNAYEKLNGFLGMVSFDHNKGDFYTATKSAISGEHADILREHFDSLMDTQKKDYLKGFFNENNVTLVFEVIDNVKDPHIIKYDGVPLVLLAIVENTLHFKKRSYEENIELAEALEIPYAQRKATFHTWEEFLYFYSEYMEEDVFDVSLDKIEGYIIESANGFLTKLKGPLYSYWKKFRSELSWLASNPEKVAGYKGTFNKRLIELGLESLDKKEPFNFVDFLYSDEMTKIIKSK